jgi:hypothetical protein
MADNHNQALADLARQLRETQEALAAAKAETEAARKASFGTLRCKVSDKGGLSVYGLGRFPVTLYASQWRALISNLETIQSALTDNKDKLTEKS